MVDGLIFWLHCLPWTAFWIQLYFCLLITECLNRLFHINTLGQLRHGHDYRNIEVILLDKCTRCWLWVSKEKRKMLDVKIKFKKKSILDVYWTHSWSSWYRCTWSSNKEYFKSKFWHDTYLINKQISLFKLVHIWTFRLKPIFRIYIQKIKDLDDYPSYDVLLLYISSQCRKLQMLTIVKKTTSLMVLWPERYWSFDNLKRLLRLYK